MAPITVDELLAALNAKPGTSYIATIKDVQNVNWELRCARLASPSPARSDRAAAEGREPDVRRVETVTEDSLYQEPGAPLWRVTIGPEERCFDFDDEHQARLLSRAVGEALAAPAPEGVDPRIAELREIADGANGEGPRARGLARDELARLVPQADKVDAPRVEPPPGVPVLIQYTNHRGLDAARVIIPTGRMIQGPNEWHPDAPWLIEAWDVNKAAMRTFDPAKLTWIGRA